MKKLSKGECPLCHEHRYLQTDHIIPRCLGGASDAANIQLICYDCHYDKTCAEWHSYPSWQLTEEQKARIGRAFKGRKATMETRERMSQAQKGRPRSLEQRQKISDALKGRPCTPERRAQLVGQPQSEETKARMRAANNPGWYKK